MKPWSPQGRRKPQRQGPDESGRERAEGAGACRLQPLVSTSPLPVETNALKADERPLVALLIAAAAFVVGACAAWHYARAGLTLSHYDARAHLVVARRIFDGLTPGWQQVGAVWLPLPHLLNMLPVQVDAWYRSGASGVAISVLSVTMGAWGLSTLLMRTTGSVVGAITAVALLVGNPNVLYLQSTPMTEPVLFGTTLLALALSAQWIDRGGHDWPVGAGAAMAAACLTRYEAWPMTAATITIAGAALHRRGAHASAALAGCARFAAFPAAAVLLFAINSRWTIGHWFVTGGFFVVENTEALGHPLVALEQVRDGLYRLSGTAAVWSAYAGAGLVVLTFVRSRARAPVALVLALSAAAALPWYAYLQGHPFRIRYDLPLVAAAAALTGAGIGLLHAWLRPFAAVLVIAAALLQAPPLDRRAPLVAESQRDASNMAARRPVSAYLAQHFDGQAIMMSMGSLGHYMQDLSANGFAIRNFLHEGNGDIWNFAILRPAGIVGWIAIEETAEGGDALYWEARRNRRFLEGFVRVAEGGGVALYRSARP